MNPINEYQSVLGLGAGSGTYEDQYGSFPVSGETVADYGNGYAGPEGNGMMDYLGLLMDGKFGTGGLNNLGGGEGDFLSKLTDMKGLGGSLLGLGKLGMGYMQGKEKMDLARDQLKQNQQQYRNNHNAQAGLQNTRMEDRQRARLAADAGAGNYRSVSEYMGKNRVATV